MAELDFDQFDNGRSGTRSAPLTGLLNIAGGVCSIALVVGLGVWGYKLAVRDVNGVPVIRAMTGPMRVMPQAPGGDVASFQGLSVNAVAAVGMAASMPDQVLLAPAPVELAAEDAPGLGVHDPAVVAGGAEIAACFAEIAANIAAGAVKIVGQGLNDQADTAGGIALIAHHFVVFAACSRSLADGALNPVLWHRHGARIGHGKTQTWVHRRIRHPRLRRRGDFAGNLGEGLGADSVLAAFAVHGVLEFRMAGHGRVYLLSLGG
jgi:hypothetical protein